MSLPKIARSVVSHRHMIYINNPATYNPAVVTNSTVYDLPLDVCLLTVTDPEVTSPTRVRSSYEPI